MGTAHLVERSTGKSHNFAGSSPRCGKGFVSLSQLPVQTLSRCPYSPNVQSHAPASVYTLKVPNTGNHTIVWTQGNIAQTDSNG